MTTSEKYAVHLTYKGTGVDRDKDLCRLIEFRDGAYQTVAHFSDLALASIVANLLNRHENPHD